MVRAHLQGAYRLPESELRLAQRPLSEQLCRETLALLDRHEGNQSAAAREAGVNLKTFHSRVITARDRFGYLPVH